MKARYYNYNRTLEVEITTKEEIKTIKEMLMVNMAKALSAEDYKAADEVLYSLKEIKEAEEALSKPATAPVEDEVEMEEEDD